MDDASRADIWKAHLHILATLIVPLLLFAAVASRVGGATLESVAVLLFINLLLVTGLQIFQGNSGVGSFGHMSFMAIGAYVSAMLTLSVETKASGMPELYTVLAQTELPLLPAMLIGVVAATLVAAVVIYPIVRLSNPIAAVISTFALLIVSNTVINQWDEVTNGVRCVYGLQRYTTVWTAATFAIVGLVLAYWFKESRLGLRLRASRDDAQAAASIGIRIPRLRYVAFLVSVVLTSIAGALWAHFVLSFSPHSFYLAQTFIVVAMLVIGGMESVSGAVVGTVVVTVIKEGLQYVESSLNIAGVLPFTLFGTPVLALCVAMMVIMILRPDGLTKGREIRMETKWGRSGPATLEPTEQQD